MGFRLGGAAIQGVGNGLIQVLDIKSIWAICCCLPFSRARQEGYNLPLPEKPESTPDASATPPIHYRRASSPIQAVPHKNPLTHPHPSIVSKSRNFTNHYDHPFSANNSILPLLFLMWRPEDTALPLPTDVPHSHNIKKQKTTACHNFLRQPVDFPLHQHLIQPVN